MESAAVASSSRNASLRLCMHLMQPNVLLQINYGDWDVWSKNEHWIRAHAFSNKLIHSHLPFHSPGPASSPLELTYAYTAKNSDTFYTIYIVARILCAVKVDGIKFCARGPRIICNISRWNRHSNSSSSDIRVYRWRSNLQRMNSGWKSILSPNGNSVEHIIMMRHGEVAWRGSFKSGHNQFNITWSKDAHVPHTLPATRRISPQQKHIVLWNYLES